MDNTDWAAAVRSAAQERMQAREQAAFDAGHPEWVDLPMTREAAQRAKATRYFTGWACDHGHAAPRLTKGNACVVCHAQAQVRWQQGAGHQQYNAYMRDYMRAYRKQGAAR